jgi:hypothetical protein
MQQIRNKFSNFITQLLILLKKFISLLNIRDN